MLTNCTINGIASFEILLLGDKQNPNDFPLNSGRDPAGQKAITAQRVLILEDERLVAESLKQILEDHGHHVIAVVASGEEAVETAAATNPDLLLMDIRVKGNLDGIQSAVLIQKSQQKNLPVVFLTAHSRDQFPHLDELDTAQFVYLNKPYSQQDLLEAIANILRKKR